MKSCPETLTVCLHAFVIDEAGDCYYVDDQEEKATGWCVYVRSDSGDDTQPFDIEVQEDFTNFVEANAHAVWLARSIGAKKVYY